jgi:hypothetical protein
MFNFNVAMRPQIIKCYASAQKDEMISLVFRCVKASWFLMYIFALPLTLEMSTVLSLWLKNPPQYTAMFTRLALIEILIGSFSVGFSSGITATGKIMMREIVVGGIYFLNLPLSWFAIAFAGLPYYVALVMVCLTFIALIAEILIAQRLLFFPLKRLFSDVMLPFIMVSIISMVLPVVLHSILTQGIFRLCIVTVTSVLSLCISMYLCGLNHAERSLVKKVVINRIKMFCKHRTK